MRTFVAALVALTLCAAPLAQASRPWYLAPPDFTAAGFTIATFMSAVRNWGAERDRINSDLTRARAAFWAEYPDGQRLAQTRSDFAAALLARDLANAALESNRQLYDGVAPGTAFGDALSERVRAIEKLLNLLSSPGGTIQTVAPTPAFAAAAFNHWVSRLVDGAKLGLTQDAVYERAFPEYEAYVLVRNRAELLFDSPKSPLTATDAPAQTFGLFLACGDLSWSEAAGAAEAMIGATASSPGTLAAANKAALAELSSNSRASNSCVGRNTLVSRLARTNPTVFALDLVASATGDSTYIKAADLLSKWQAQVGRVRMEREASRVQIADQFRRLTQAGLPAEADLLRPKMDVPASCIALGSMGCLTTLLGVPAPVSANQLTWQTRYSGATSALNRPATRDKILASLASNAAAGSTAARYQRLVGWIDEDLLLAAYGNEGDPAAGNFYNFSLLPSNRRAMVAGVLIFDKVRANPGTPWPDLALALESVKAEHDELIRSTPPQKLDAALVATRQRVQPTERWAFSGDTPAETPYTLLLKNLGVDVAAREAARTARLARTNDAVTADLQSLTKNASFCGGTSSIERATQLTEAWGAYLDDGQTDALVAAAPMARSASLAWTTEAQQLSSSISAQAKARGARTFTQAENAGLTRASCLENQASTVDGLLDAFNTLAIAPTPKPAAAAERRASLGLASDPIPAGSQLARTLEYVDESWFRLRSILYGMNEEAAIDQIRGLLFRANMNADRPALDQAIADTRALLSRYDRQPVGDRATTRKFITLELQSLSERAQKWGEGPSGAGISRTGGPERETLLAQALSVHRGELEGQFHLCAVSRVRGFAIDGLPASPVTVTFAAPQREMRFEVAPSSAGHSRVVFHVEGRQLCTEGTWTAAAGGEAAVKQTAPPQLAVAPRAPEPTPAPRQGATTPAPEGAPSRATRSLPAVPGTWNGTLTFDTTVTKISIQFKDDSTLDLTTQGRTVASGSWSRRSNGIVFVDARHQRLGAFTCELRTTVAAISGRCMANRQPAGDILLSENESPRP